jgi:hypothetical protein
MAKPKKCRSCSASLVDPLPGQDRCSGCQVNFERWLRNDSPTTYTPRRDGVWRDIARPVRE